MSLRRDAAGDAAAAATGVLPAGSAFTLTGWLNRRVAQSTWEQAFVVGPSDPGFTVPSTSTLGVQVRESSGLWSTTNASSAGWIGDVIWNFGPPGDAVVDQWVFFALLFDGATVGDGRLRYVKFARAGSGAWDYEGARIDGSGTISHGGNVMLQGIAGLWFNGSYVSLKMFNRVLTAAEAFAQRTQVAPTADVAADCAAWWPLRDLNDGGSDLSGNGRHFSALTGWTHDTDNPAALDLGAPPPPPPPPNTGAHRGDGTQLRPRLLTGTGMVTLRSRHYVDPPGGPETVVTGLAIPWGMDFLPDGDMLITERGGMLKRLGASPGEWPVTVGTFDVPGMGNEGGLLGLAVHPDFATNNYVYIYYTRPDLTANEVVRSVLGPGGLTFDQTIIAGIPASVYHNGGQLNFGPDGMLYITTGDANEDGQVPPEDNFAQDLSSLGGKILRVTDTGAVPAGNPFIGHATADERVWTWGHRNPQGITWDSAGRCYSTEHGPWPGRDEVNLIEPGNNYGWPFVIGSDDHTGTGFTPPLFYSPATAPSWAFGQCAALGDRLYWTGLNGQSLFAGHLDAAGAITTVDRHYHTEYGRLRGMTVHEGWVYFATTNRDQNGTPRPGDDRLMRVQPSNLPAT